MDQPTLSRRSLLAALGAGAIVLPTFMGARANAAEVGGYKAMVCIFLFGGMDSHELLIPHDQASLDTYTQLRQGIAPTGSRTHEALLALNPANAADFGSRAFALPPEMSGIRTLFNEGRASIVANVGPLIRPVTRTAFENRSVSLPPRLFSHNDQQAVWRSGRLTRRRVRVLGGADSSLMLPSRPEPIAMPKPSAPFLQVETIYSSPETGLRLIA